MSAEHADPGEAWYDRTIVDSAGAKIGTIADVYFDHETHRPEWALVHTGLFGTRETIVPITTVASRGDDLVVPFEKSFVKAAPAVGSDEELSEADETTLARYYGLQYSKARLLSGVPTAGGGEPPAGRVAQDSGDDALTPSEEELHVDTVHCPSELVRLKQHAVTEPQQVTAPGQRQELRFEREPGTGAEREDSGSSAPAAASEIAE
jgi:sporulation protein YlmC with PRC-barrel domain